MTRERINELWPVMEAFRDGKRIDKRHRLEDGSWSDWMEAFSPIWADGCEYRVAPAPREVWVNEYQDGSLSAQHQESRQDAEVCKGSLVVRAVRFVEVIE